MPPEAKAKYILVIEDNAADSDVIISYLKKEGLAYKLTKSAAEALQAAQDDVPALIILDLMLPGINGFKLAKLFRDDAILKDTPICVISALNAASDKELAKRIGISDYLGKPFDTEKFSAVVKKYL